MRTWRCRIDHALARQPNLRILNNSARYGQSNHNKIIIIRARTDSIYRPSWGDQYDRYHRPWSPQLGDSLRAGEAGPPSLPPKNVRRAEPVHSGCGKCPTHALCPPPPRRAPSRRSPRGTMTRTVPQHTRGRGAAGTNPRSTDNRRQTSTLGIQTTFVLLFNGRSRSGRIPQACRVRAARGVLPL